MQNPLAGCFAKLDRASETIEGLAREIHAFCLAARNSVRVEGRHSKDGLEYEFIAFGKPETPARFAVLAGEVVHHLRSSLDHLLWALVINNGGVPSRQHQYPISKSQNDFIASSARIEGVSDSAKALIASTQPFTSDPPGYTILSAVNELDNIDKHRLLVVLATVATVGRQINIRGAPPEGAKHAVITGLGNPDTVPLAQDGSLFFSMHLAEPAPYLDATAELVVNVAIESFGQQPYFPLIDALRLMLEGTRHTLNLFRGEFRR